MKRATVLLLADRPVLFVDGGLDTDCPAAANAKTVRLINARGGQAEQFVDPDAGHAFSPPCGPDSRAG